MPAHRWRIVVENTAPDGSIDNFIILGDTGIGVAAQAFTLGGPVSVVYPDLKVAWSEAGIGWIPFYLDRCDRHFQNQRWLRHDFGGKVAQRCVPGALPGLLRK